MPTKWNNCTITPGSQPHMCLGYYNNGTVTCKQSTCPGYKFRAPLYLKGLVAVKLCNTKTLYGLYIEDGVQRMSGGCAAVIDWLQYRWFTAIELACH